MTGWHCTTIRKLSRYVATGAILPPVRFWPNEFTARRWMKRVGRDVLLKISVEGEHYPLPDHVPARWTPSLIRSWDEVAQA